MIAGVLAPDEGTIAFRGQRIDGMPADAVCRLGIGRTFQIVRPFPALSVEDNVVVGALLHRADVAAARRHARDVLAKLDLFDKRSVTAAAPDAARPQAARIRPRARDRSQADPAGRIHGRAESTGRLC